MVKKRREHSEDVTSINRDRITEVVRRKGARS